MQAFRKKHRAGYISPRNNIHRSYITYYIVSLTSLLKSNIEDLNHTTGELFVSVDNACHMLDKMTLPEGYVTTIKR